MAARQGTRCHVPQSNVLHAQTEVQLVVGGDRHAAAAGGERVRRAEVDGGAGRGGPSAGGPSSAAPLTNALVVVCGAVVASNPGQSSDGAAGGQGSCRAGAGGRGCGRDRGGAGRGRAGGARVGPAAVEAAGAGGKGGKQGESDATGPLAETFTPAESDRPGASVVTDILEVSEEEGEGAGRMAVVGGQRQLVAPNVPAAAIKGILPAVQRKEEGKGERGQPGTGVTGCVSTGGHIGGQGQTGTGGKGQAGTPGTRRTAGQQGGGAGESGGGQGH